MYENCHDYYNYQKYQPAAQLTQNSGAWITTFSAKQFFPFSPREEDIDIVDIAHHLSLINRFTGATLEPYSVAEHSWRASYLVSPENALWALLHDAPEAYISDMSRPLKHHTSVGLVYLEVEKKIMSAICRKFGLPEEEPAEIKLADNRMLMTEKRDLLRYNLNHPSWNIDAEPLPEFIHPFSWKNAKKLFLARYKELTYGKTKNT